jgi:transposase
MAARKKSRSGGSGNLRHTAPEKPEPGHVAQGAGQTLRSYAVGGLPILNQLLERMRLEELLAQHLPADDPRLKVPTARALLLLIRNVLLAREPIYGVGEWARWYAPDLLNLWPQEVAHVQDDRLGRCLACLFGGIGPELILAVVRHVIQEFGVSLDELHNDSTTISFFGAYLAAQQEGKRGGRPTHAITWGHSKDHRPDLKQLLYTLTVSDDGGVPVYFTSESGNVVDDQTHRQTWDLLRQLVERPDFLYVADCKLASTENMNYIAQQGGRFLSVLPRTRKEDADFRGRLQQEPNTISWRHLYDVTDEEGQVIDRLSACAEEAVSAEGYRLLWFHSSRKAELDQVARARRTQRALTELAQLRDRLHSPRTRFRQPAKVNEAVAEILQRFQVEPWVVVQIHQRQQAKFRQEHPGRPSPQTRYVKQVAARYSLSWEIDAPRLVEDQATDGVFPLISNLPGRAAEQLLRAYKRQPIIEKRFSQLKTDFAVAPVYLKEVSRIQGLLAVYFFVLLVQTLLERELRRAMAREGVSSLPLYPEHRPCQRPTTRRVLELFEPIQRHTLTMPSGRQEVLVTELSPLQRRILKLLKLSVDTYGR